MSEEQEIKKPSNIKQIGIIDDNFKVYIEDYADTFLKQYSKESGCEERIAVLLGRSCIIDGTAVVFVSGIIKGEYAEEENGKCIFSEKSWEYIKEKKKRYFPEQDIVGWAYIQPGFGDELNAFQEKYHSSIFREPNQVILLCDPIEKTNTFYSRISDQNGNKKLHRLGGYIIYYDKNEEMNLYMTENKSVKIDTDEEAEMQKNNDEKLRRAVMKSLTEKKSREKRKTITFGKIPDQKKLVNLFGTLSAILFVICFVMGAGLVKNDSRIARLEAQLSDISNSYSYITSRLTEDNAQPVFADNQQSISSEENNISATENIDFTAGETFSEAATVPSPTVPASAENKEDAVRTDTYSDNTASLTTTDEKNTRNETNKKIEDKKAATPHKYTVIKGDTLNLISRKIYGHSDMVNEIMAANAIEDPNRIQIGEVLILPEENTK